MKHNLIGFLLVVVSLPLGTVLPVYITMPMTIGGAILSMTFVEKGFQEVTYAGKMVCSLDGQMHHCHLCMVKHRAIILPLSAFPIFNKIKPIYKYQWILTCDHCMEPYLPAPWLEITDLSDLDGLIHYEKISHRQAMEIIRHTQELYAAADQRETLLARDFSPEAFDYKKVRRQYIGSIVYTAISLTVALEPEGWMLALIDGIPGIWWICVTFSKYQVAKRKKAAFLSGQFPAQPR